MTTSPLASAGRRAAAALLLAFALAGSACFGPTAEEKLRAELMAMTKEDCFEKGKALIAKKSWEEGRKYLSFVYENYPSDPLSREALLRLADSYYAEGTEAAFIEGLYRYRDYQSRYPNRPESDYVLMRIADCLRRQAASAERDQSNTRKALVQYQDLLRMYPQTTRRDEVIERIRKCRLRLAEHELAVGRFYYRRGFSVSAVDRLSALLENYPDYAGTDEVLYYLIRSCLDAGKVDEAAFFRKRLEREFPTSSWLRKAPSFSLPEEPAPAESPAPPSTGAEPPAASPPSTRG